MSLSASAMSLSLGRSGRAWSCTAASRAVSGIGTPSQACSTANSERLIFVFIRQIRPIRRISRPHLEIVNYATEFPDLAQHLIDPIVDLLEARFVGRVEPTFQLRYFAADGLNLFFESRRRVAPLFAQVAQLLLDNFNAPGAGLVVTLAELPRYRLLRGPDLKRLRKDLLRAFLSEQSFFEPEGLIGEHEDESNAGQPRRQPRRRLDLCNNWSVHEFRY